MSFIPHQTALKILTISTNFNDIFFFLCTGSSETDTEKGYMQ